jgi:hypothetical protein
LYLLELCGSEELGVMRDYRSPRQLPTVDPGQIWLIEQDPALPLSAVDCDVLTSANVVIYDRALAPLVAQVLPIGGYAEPLPVAGHASDPAISPRALALAGEGWSVAQLVEASPSQRSRMRILPPALVRGGAGNSPVRVIAKAAADRCSVLDVGLCELAEFLGEFGKDELLTLIFGPVLGRNAAQAHAFTFNGLAG